MLFPGVPSANAADSITRRDGFLLIWNSIQRPAESVRETPYEDVKKGSIGYTEITYAKARGLLRDAAQFYPDETLQYADALLILFRTRNIEPIDQHGDRKHLEIAEVQDIPAIAAYYNLSEKEGAISESALLDLMRTLDTALATEEHEVSLYSEKFHGKGTGFGETFDMHAFTAAHRSFPYNTMVRVTNISNDKSVTVRINDRGPFVQGRDMDLSLGAFTSIEDRSKGKFMARFERLGDVTRISACKDDRMQRRITRDVRIDPGIPHRFPLGQTLSFRSSAAFVVRDILYPDGGRKDTQTWLTSEEAFEFTPNTTGLYTFLMGTKEGRVREMRMEVVECGA